MEDEADVVEGFNDEGQAALRARRRNSVVVKRRDASRGNVVLEISDDEPFVTLSSIETHVPHAGDGMTIGLSQIFDATGIGVEIAVGQGLVYIRPAAICSFLEDRSHWLDLEYIQVLCRGVPANDFDLESISAVVKGEQNFEVELTTLVVANGGDLAAIA